MMSVGVRPVHLGRVETKKAGKTNQKKPKENMP